MPELLKHTRKRTLTIKPRRISCPFIDDTRHKQHIIHLLCVKLIYICVHRLCGRHTLSLVVIFNVYVARPIFPQKITPWILYTSTYTLLLYKCIYRTQDSIGHTYNWQLVRYGTIRAYVCIIKCCTVYRTYGAHNNEILILCRVRVSISFIQYSFGLCHEVYYVYLPKSRMVVVRYHANRVHYNKPNRYNSLVQ